MAHRAACLGLVVPQRHVGGQQEAGQDGGEGVDEAAGPQRAVHRPQGQEAQVGRGGDHPEPHKVVHPAGIHTHIQQVWAPFLEMEYMHPKDCRCPPWQRRAGKTGASIGAPSLHPAHPWSL